MTASFSSRVLVASAASVAALALGAFHAYGAGAAHDWPHLRLLAAFLIVFLVPGHFLLWALGRRAAAAGELPEWCVRSLGVGLVLLTAGYGLATLGLAFSVVLGCQLALNVLLISFGASRRFRQRAAWTLPVKVGVLAVAFVTVSGLFLAKLGGLEGVVPRPREEPDLVAARKILTLPTIEPEGLSYAPNRTSFPFSLPTYAFGLASMSCLSGLDPLQVFEFSRPMWGIAALLALYALARRLFASDAAGLSIVASVAVLALGISEIARLVPFGARGDIALAVLLPASLTLALAFVTGEARPRGEWLLAPLCIAAARLAAASIAPTIFLFLAGSALVSVARARRWTAAGRALWLASWLAAASALPSGESEDASAIRTAAAGGESQALVGREALFEPLDLLSLPVALLLGGLALPLGRLARSLTRTLEEKLGPRRRIDIWLGELARSRPDGVILLPATRTLARIATLSVLAILLGALASLWSFAPARRPSSTSGGSLLAQWRASASKADLSDVSSWIQATRYLDLPEPMLGFLWTQRPGQVYAYSADRIVRLAVVTPHYVFSSGDPRPEEAAFLETFARLHGLELPPRGSSRRGSALAGLYASVLDRFPLANDEDDPSLTETWLQELAIDFAIWKSRDPGATIPARLPSRFVRSFQSFRSSLYRVRRD